MKLFFMLLSWQKALLRHVKARDVCDCLGLYPETARSGFENISVLFDIVI